MGRLKLAYVMVMLFASTAVAAPQEPPVEKIRAVYAHYAANTNSLENDPAARSNSALARSFFTPDFIRVLEKSEQCWDGPGEGVQMWVAGSDWGLSDLQITVAESTDNGQRVRADFKNFDEPQTWIYDFVRQDHTWLVTNVWFGATPLSSHLQRSCLTQVAATSGPQPLSSFKDCDACPEMVVLAPGRFLMGASKEDRKYADRYTLSTELPQHEVRIDYRFAMAKFELSVAEFAAYVAETGAQTGGECQLRTPDRGPHAGKFIGTLKQGGEHYPPGVFIITDGNFKRPGANVTDRHPATCISRREAKAYLDWLASKTGRPYRFPTEAEWEYAVRAGNPKPFHYGGGLKQLCKYGNFADRKSPYHARMMAKCAENPSPLQTAPVGSYTPNAWGLHDMVGNAFEFVEDCASQNYKGAPTDGSPYGRGSNCANFMSRGYFFDSMGSSLRSAARCAVVDWDGRSNGLTIRAAVSLDDTAWDK